MGSIMVGSCIGMESEIKSSSNFLLADPVGITLYPVNNFF